MTAKLEHLLRAEFDPGFEKRARFIFEAIESRKPKKILDAGCGRGFYSHSASFYPFVDEICGFDLNKKYLSIAKSHCTDPRIKLINANIYALPYPDGYFDFIIFSEVLEHVEDEKKALGELKRVLKKNGVIALTVPNEDFPFLWDPLNWLLMKLFGAHISKDIWWLAGIWADHERLYTAKKLSEAVRSNGFVIKKSEKAVHWCWPFMHFILYGIGKNLVELGGFKMGNRFSFKKHGMISLMLAYTLKAPSLFFDSVIPLSSAVNTCLLLKKGSFFGNDNKSVRKKIENGK